MFGIKKEIELRRWSDNRLSPGQPVLCCVHKVTRPDAKRGSQLQNHFQARLFFTAFQTMYERVNHTNALAQLLQSKSLFHPVRT